MALPLNFTNDNDTLATVAWESVNNDMVNLLTKGAEVLIPELARRNRVFAVPNAEFLSSTVYFADPGDATYASVTPGTFGAGTSTPLGVTSTEFMTKSLWTHDEWQNNVIWPTTMPEGTDLSFHVGRAKAKVAVIREREEALLCRGAATITGTYTRKAPYAGDDDYTAGFTMSLLGLYASGTEQSGLAGAIDKSGEEFAHIRYDDASEWGPSKTAGTANGSELWNDIELALSAAYYGDAAPNFGLVPNAVWNKLNDLARDKGALPQPAMADVVKHPSQSVMVGGIPVVWSRHMADKHVLWDFAAGATQHYPVLLLDLNSLRMNIPVSGGEVDGLQFVRKISSVQVQERYPHTFYRICAKRSYSLDNGRRSFGAVAGITL